MPQTRTISQPWLLGCVLLCAMGGACSQAQFEDVRDAGNATEVRGPKDIASDAPVPAGMCVPGSAARTKGKAAACSCDDECQTGYCVDGICCSSACAATCMACNLPSSLGDCAFVPAGRKPNDPLTCAATTPATCGQDGTCDGRGGCRVYVAGTECRPGHCDGDQVRDILTCDGNGQCSQSISRTCPPYSCDPATNRCATSCTTNAQCAAGQECLAQRCGLSANGAVCRDGADCASGFCVDGVCCNVACSGPCVSCDQTGVVGRCAYLAAGLSDPACAAADPSSCGRTGLCDGFGSCTLYPEDTICRPSSCSGLVENTPHTCDGMGTCRESELVDCAPFLCTGGACATSCDPRQSDACEPGHACVAQDQNGVTAGVCGQRKNGQPCGTAADCESRQCVDGVCCESDCAGACRSCNLPGSPGRCLTVAPGAPDPHRTCQDLGPAACSTNGVCDGNGSCQSYAAGTVCGKQGCVAGAYTPPPTCNASGQCVASRSRTCNPFVCNGDTCFTACSTDEQCVAGEFCVHGSCGLKPKGADCTTAKECQSGFCAQGVCCDSACTEACMACDLTASAGTCSGVPDHEPDPQGKCVASPPATCGTTGLCSKSTCAFDDPGLNCKTAVCATQMSLTPASTCDGKGACVTPSNLSCGTFNCVDGACKTGCTPATEAQDCAPPNSCMNNTCGLRVNGAVCTAANQCQSGFCTEGVCCNNACADAPDGLCKTCKGTKTIPAGTCGNVDSGTGDPKSRCTKSNVANGDCSNDGTCNGAGACRPWSSTTGCRQESCTGSTHTLPATCSGTGTCPAAVTVSCGAYVCNSTSPTCLNTCASDADCTGGLTCLKTTNRCGDKLGTGESCVANSDCASGLVCAAEGVCCDNACAGGCQSCKLSGKAGICSNIAAGNPPRATVPATCTASASGSCGASGSCDGSGGCQQRTTCTVAVTACPADPHLQYSTAGLCSTSGVCGPLTTSCNTGYLCATGGVCATSCTAANASTNCDVANGYSCIGGFCQKKANGTTCARSYECATGNCVDGVCCVSASCPDCQSCNLPGQAGTCRNVAANSADGNCTGSCPSPTSAAGLCDGAGTCKPPTPCATGYACTAGICVTSCTSNADCAADYACAAGGACKLATGQACGGSGECASGSCVDGICCSSASCAVCSACNVAGQLGTCAPVAAGVADGPCVASCVGAQLGGLCDGNGNCQPAAACPNGYLCNTSTQCATSCTTSCASGYYCAANVCVVQKANGTACADGGECSTGQCVDGACCGSPSCADCSACNVAGHAGACYPVAAGTADGACIGLCPAGSNQTTGLCDGAGTCRTAAACPGGNLCGANDLCATDCSSVGCSSGYYCAGTTCTALKTNGAACAADVECQHGHCISNGTASICCSSACANVTCGSTAWCNASGNGCQSPRDGSTCNAGAPACSTDGRSSLAATGTCTGGVCQAAETPCLTGYLCVGTACVAPGGCTAESDCDTAQQYTCNLSTGNCELLTPNASSNG
jgi:hypothetical protein